MKTTGWLITCFVLFLPHVVLGKPATSRYDRYIKKISQTLKRKPKSPRLHTILGRLYVRAGQPDKALHHYKQALRYDRHFTHAQVGIAHIYMTQKKRQRAYTLLQRVLKRTPKHAPALAELSEYYRDLAGSSKGATQQKHLKRSINLLKKALKHSPKSHAYRYRLGLLYLASQQLAQARVAFIGAVAQRSFHPCYQLGLTLSETLLQQKNSHTQYNKLLRWRPQCGHPLLERIARRLLVALGVEIAQKLQEKGSVKEAISFFQGVNKQVPHSRQGMMFLAFLYYQHNDCQKVKQTLTQLVRRYPKHAPAKKLLADKKFMRCTTVKKIWKPKIRTSLQILRIHPSGSVTKKQPTRPKKR